MNYKEALNRLETPRKKDSKKLQNNTYLEKRGENIAVRLHETDVLTYTPKDKIILNSGGWKTPTTKDRINTYLPYNAGKGFYLSQDAGIWYLHDRTALKTFVFTDNIEIHKGKVKGQEKSDPKQLKKEISKVNQYCKNFAKALVSGNIPAPGAGDCWFCLMVTQDGKTLGDSTKNEGHLIDHIKEKYYVPSLLTNAIKDSPGAISQYTEGIIYTAWNEPEKLAERLWSDIAERQITRALKIYMKKRLGHAW